MKKASLLVFVVLFIQNTIAQNLEWAKRIGGDKDDEPSCIAVDASGNVYTTGHFRDTVDFDPGPRVFNLVNAGVPGHQEEVFISKLDASGNFVWAKNVGGESAEYPQSIAVDSYGNVYVAGYFFDLADFDPGPAEFNMSTAHITDSFATADGFILKLDASGNFIWAKRFGGLDADFILSMTLDKAGNVYATGYFSGTSDFDPGNGINNLVSEGQYDVFILKLEASGNLIWAKSIGGTGKDFVSAIAVDANENVIITGTFEGKVDFDPGPDSSYLDAGSAHFKSAHFNFIAKLDASGNFIWAKKAGQARYDPPNSLAVDSSGNIFIAATFIQTAELAKDTGAFILTSLIPGIEDIFIAKINTSGNFVWAKSIGVKAYEGTLSIALDGYGNIFTTGWFMDTVDFDPGKKMYRVITPGEMNAFILKLNPAGDFMWVRNLGDKGKSVTADHAGNVYATGYFWKTADLDPGPRVLNFMSAGLSDIFIVKLRNK